MVWSLPLYLKTAKANVQSQRCRLHVDSSSSTAWRVPTSTGADKSSSSQPSQLTSATFTSLQLLTAAVLTHCLPSGSCVIGTTTFRASRPMLSVGVCYRHCQSLHHRLVLFLGVIPPSPPLHSCHGAHGTVSWILSFDFAPSETIQSYGRFSNSMPIAPTMMIGWLLVHGNKEGYCSLICIPHSACLTCELSIGSACSTQTCPCVDRTKCSQGATTVRHNSRHQYGQSDFGRTRTGNFRITFT